MPVGPVPSNTGALFADGVKYGNNVVDVVEATTKTVDDIISDLPNTTSVTGKVTTQFTSKGGYEQALEDFNSLGLTDIVDYGDGKFRGTLEGGTTVMVMKTSKTGPVTLQIQYSKRNLIKIRYE